MLYAIRYTLYGMYIDLLTRIKNAQKAKKELLRAPYSGMDLAVAELLLKHKFLESVGKKGRMPKRVLEIRPRYVEGRGAVRGVRLLSKSSRRLYTGYSEIRPVRQGYGILVLSTPKGILDGKTAKKAKVGGELLFEIW